VFLKSKKTATDISSRKSASRALLRGLAGVLFLLIAGSANVAACDMSTFVQSEFAERCQLLLDLCEKTDLVRSLHHPDIKIHSGALSREWVRFFLAHGNHASIPPTLAFIGSDSWSDAMQETGQAISRLINTGIDKADFNRLNYRIQLLKEPQRIEKLHQVFKSRREFIEKSSKTDHDVLAGSDSDRRKTWIDQALLITGTAIDEQLVNDAELQHKLRTDVDAHIETFKRIMEQETAGTDREVIEILFNSLQQEINLDMSFWEALFFYSTR
jgi:hypothetical protein